MLLNEANKDNFKCLYHTIYHQFINSLIKMRKQKKATKKPKVLFFSIERTEQNEALSWLNARTQMKRLGEKIQCTSGNICVCVCVIIW